MIALVAVRISNSPGALFAWLISHQPAVLFSHNKPATSNQPAVPFSQNKPAPAISHQPTEQTVRYSKDLTFCSLVVAGPVLPREKHLHQATNALWCGSAMSQLWARRTHFRVTLPPYKLYRLFDLLITSLTLILLKKMCEQYFFPEQISRSNQLTIFFSQNKFIVQISRRSAEQTHNQI
jgi:hypothetical protein